MGDYLHFLRTALPALVLLPASRHADTSTSALGDIDGSAMSVRIKEPQ
jgi:hypothetical protein